MKTPACAFVGLLVLTLSAMQLIVADDQVGNATKKDMEALQGKWTLVSAYKDGSNITKQCQEDGFGIEFKGGAWLQDWKGYHLYEAADSQITLDPSKSPKAFDHIVTRDDRGHAIKIVYPGIYEIDGDSLEICFDVDMKSRPTKFTSDEKSSYFLAKLKHSPTNSPPGSADRK